MKYETLTSYADGTSRYDPCPSEGEGRERLAAAQEDDDVTRCVVYRLEGRGRRVIENGVYWAREP